MPENCRFKNTRTDRTGLYIMVAIAMISGCDSLDRINEVKPKVEKLETSVQSLRQEVQNLGLNFNNAMPILQETKGQKFYMINGQRAYTEINGRPASSYDMNNIFLEK